MSSDFGGFSSVWPLPADGTDGGVAPVSDVRADAPDGIMVTDRSTAAATLSQIFLTRKLLPNCVLVIYGSTR